MPGPANSFCHKMLCFLPLIFGFFGSLVIVVACYRAMQRVTVNHDCVFCKCFAPLNCGKSVIFSFCLQQCIDCVLNLPLNERQCLVQAEQGVYAIKSPDI